ncbi:MAG: membrane dipeptidase [Anaerolineales bacterium]|nr:membrane dipeptidase [Anaerolineales bacterium]
MPILVDAHQDLAWNVLTFGRDYSRSALETRALEQRDGLAVQHNGSTLLGLPEYLQGQVAVIFATLFAAPARHLSGAWDTQKYATPQEAHALAQAQLDVYHRLADENEAFELIGTRADLERVLAAWVGPADGRRVGLVPLMEGADPIREPPEAEAWMSRGVRIVGLAWSGTRYAGGTGEPGPLTPDGRRLLETMAAAGLILDLSHASDESFLEALDRFSGTVIASHANARALLKDFARPERLLSDEMIRRLAGAGGVIGVVPYNRFLKAWQPGDGKAAVTLADVAAHIDHICQVTGSAAHVGLGSDFDGGFGVERTPAEIDTIADLQKLDGALRSRGYSPADVAGILGQNWIDLLRRGLPG